jgi:hypothetical protein
MNDTKKVGKLRSCTPKMATPVARAMPTNDPSVTRAPPILSENQPPSGRATEPMSAPTKPRPAR